MARTWILTGSPENDEATADHGFGRIERELYEDRERIWPGKPGKPDLYPWRFPTSPELVLDQPDWIPAESLATALDPVRKWPAEHWTLAFQGQIRPVSDHDAQVLIDRLSQRAAAPR